MQVLEEVGLPKGVINMIPGDPKTVSSQVLTHPDMSAIHFTGSTATFNYLWKEVGANIDKYKTYLESLVKQVVKTSYLLTQLQMLTKLQLHL